MKPGNPDFPYQIELFSRKPDLFNLNEDSHLTPIPTDDDQSSFSAILLNDDYYNYMLEHSTLENGLHRANIDSLICLKAKAYLEISKRSTSNNKEVKQLRKHKGDVFRLAVMLTENDIFDPPESIKTHLKDFMNAIESDLSDKEIFREMGMGNILPENPISADH